MSKKFVGYIKSSMDEFSVFGSADEISIFEIVKKTLSLSSKHGKLYYKTIKDYPTEAVVFATQDFSEAEGENWFEMWCNDDEQFVHAHFKDFLKKDLLGVHNHNLHEVLDGNLEEYVLENEETKFIVRFDRILVLSKTSAFITFSVHTDKLYRWFFND